MKPKAPLRVEPSTLVDSPLIGVVEGRIDGAGDGVDPVLTADELIKLNRRLSTIDKDAITTDELLKKLSALG